MSHEEIELKSGIKIHDIQTDKFKTNLIAVFLTTPLTKENVTKNALLPAVLRRGSKQLTSQEAISKHLEMMYGASFDCGVEKSGDNQILKFYLETINDNFLPQKENILQEAIETILNIVFNPYLEKGAFKEEYLKNEKYKLQQIIEGRKDNKAQYAVERCVEEMYENTPYGLYKFGSLEDLQNIQTQELYQYYQQMIQSCKIDIFVSGDRNKEQLKIDQNPLLANLEERTINNVTRNEKTAKKEIRQQPKIVEESLEVSQGKLVMGFDVQKQELEDNYIALVYNAILGGTPTSKLFQNVREKESLAYTAGSSYIKQKNAIFVKCGIEIENYEKTKKIILEQIEDMKQGKFTKENLEEAKNNIIATIKAIPEEQDTEITYYLGQELAQTKIALEENQQKVEAIEEKSVQQLAQSVVLNTIYFLKN